MRCCSTYYADGYNRSLVNATIQKSIRIDRYTFDVIDDFQGTGFSEKLREYVRIMEFVRNHPNFNRLLEESMKKM